MSHLLPLITLSRLRVSDQYYTRKGERDEDRLAEPVIGVEMVYTISDVVIAVPILETRQDRAANLQLPEKKEDKRKLIKEAI